MANSSESTFRQFVACINAHEPTAIVALCSDDHIFTDSLGSQMSGLDHLKKGWAAYFSFFPDYRIEIETVTSSDQIVLACGFAAATYTKTGTSWQIPAAWRAKIIGGRVAEWQVYADNKPVYELLSAAPNHSLKRTAAG